MGSLSERRLLAAADAVLVALPPTSTFEVRPTPDERAAHRPEQRGVAIDSVHRYNPEAVRSRAALTESIRDKGFEVLEVRDTPDRPGREFVFISARID